MRNFYYCLLLMSVIGLSSCIYDAEPGMPVSGEDEEVNVGVSIQTSYEAYSAAEDLENRITTIDILAFRVNKSGNAYQYRVKVDEDQIKNGSTTSEKKFNVKLIKSDSRYHFVFIANARAAVDAIGPMSNLVPKDTILSRLATSKQSWDLSGTPPDCIPMWGETTDPVEIVEGGEIKGIYLLRALARIDLVVKPRVTNFHLREVYLYNRYIDGRIVPAAKSWKQEDLRVISPSMPPNAVKVEAPLEYKSPAGFPNNSLTETIYTFGAIGTSEGEDLIATCLVIGGLYNTQDPADISYYRVDFNGLKREEEEGEGGEGPPGGGGGGGGGVGTKGRYLPLLRNHIHELRINSVSSQGEATPDEAFRKKRENIDIEVETWDMNNISGGISGMYRLRVSTSSLNVKPSIPGTIRVDSDNPEPWTATTSDAWIKLQKTDSYTLKVEVDAGASETGSIEVKVGNITKPITIRRVP